MHRAIRPTAMMLGLLLAAAAPARAGSVAYGDVAQVLVTSRQGTASAQLRLRNVAQTASFAAGVRARSQETAHNQNPASSDSTGATPVTNADSSVAITQDTSTPNVEIVEIGDVTGTVCDCGEIPGVILPGDGGFPLFPLFALGAIPFAFIDYGRDEEVFVTPPPPTPTPTPNNPVPEPATILLLGSGLAALGAGARRRRRSQAQQLCGTVAAAQGEV